MQVILEWLPMILVGVQMTHVCHQMIHVCHLMTHEWDLVTHVCHLMILARAPVVLVPVILVSATVIPVWALQVVEVTMVIQMGETFKKTPVPITQNSEGLPSLHLVCSPLCRP